MEKSKERSSANDQAACAPPPPSIDGSIDRRRHSFLREAFCDLCEMSIKKKALTLVCVHTVPKMGALSCVLNLAWLVESIDIDHASWSALPCWSIDRWSIMHADLRWSIGVDHACSIWLGLLLCIDRSASIMHVDLQGLLIDRHRSCTVDLAWLADLSTSIMDCWSCLACWSIDIDHALLIWPGLLINRHRSCITNPSAINHALLIDWASIMHVDLAWLAYQSTSIIHVDLVLLADQLTSCWSGFAANRLTSCWSGFAYWSICVDHACCRLI
jgi:hypothetical protein